MIKEKDRVIVDLEVYDRVKEFGNQNEIISRTKNGMKATVIFHNNKRGYATIQFDDNFYCGIDTQALKII
jgi:hypothetical protein